MENWDEIIGKIRDLREKKAFALDTVKLMLAFAKNADTKKEEQRYLRVAKMSIDVYDRHAINCTTLIEALKEIPLAEINFDNRTI